MINPFTCAWSAPELARISGASPRQIQWWDDHDIANSNLVGRRRIYDLPQALQLLAVAKLGMNRRDRGRVYIFPLLHELQRQCRSFDPAHMAPFLVITGGSVKSASSAEEAIAMMAKSLAGCRIVDLAEMRDELMHCAANRGKERAA